MTDERMDARLRAAGERWRNADTAVVERTQPSEVEIAPGTQGHSRRRNWWAIASAAVVVAALVFGGILFARAGSNDRQATAGVDQLIGVTWSDPQSQVTVVFRPNAARLSDACGTWLYQLTIDGDRLSLGKAIGRQRPCRTLALGRVPAQLRHNGERIALLYKILRGPATWSIAGNVLTLTKPGVGTLRLTTDGVTAPEPGRLIGTWRLDMLGQDGANSGGGSSATSDITITFQRDRNVVIYHTCYEMRGTASVADDRITFRALHKINTSCRSEQSEDTTVDYALSGKVSWSLSGDQLTITAGNSNLRFTKTGGTPIPDVDILTGRSWALYKIGGSTSNDTHAFEFSHDKITTFCGSSASMTLTPTQMIGVGTWTLTHDPGCPEGTTAEKHVVFGTILTGSVSWKIDGDILTITKTGVGSLTFVKEN